MTAKEIIALLSAKHAEDLFVPECKNGKSAGQEHIRLDAWAMAKSWSRPNTWGYEVKVTRADFLADQKMRSYMDYCNMFYVVAPKGVLSVDELPEGAGLMHVIGEGEGRRLSTVRKASMRDVKIPESLFRYLLMRARIGPETEQRSESDYWREWTAKKREDRILGHHVAQEIRLMVENTKRENERLTEEHAKYDDIRALLVELGWTLDAAKYRWVDAASVRQKIETVVPREISLFLSNSIRELTNLQTEIARATSTVVRNLSDLPTENAHVSDG